MATQTSPASPALPRLGVPDGAAGPVPGLWAAVAVVCVANFVMNMDTGAVAVAIPVIGTDLSIAGEDLNWVTNAFTLALGGFLLLFGRVADVFGRRRVFFLGCLLYAVAAFGCAAAGSAELLIAFRALLGVGGAIILAAGLGIILSLTPGSKERAAAMGAWGASTGGAAAFGLIAGGALTDGAGWEWIFYANVPVLILVAVATLRYIPEIEGRRDRHLDLLGAFLAIVGITAVLLGVVKSTDWGWSDARTIGCIAGGAVVLVLFLLAERRDRDPLVPLAMFRNRNVAGGNFALFFAGGIPVAFFLLALYLQPVLGYSATQTGLAYLPISVTAVTSGIVTAQLVTRIGPRLPVTAGLLVAGAGLLWLSERLTIDGSYGTIAVPSLLVGAGLGAAIVGGIMAASEAFDDDTSGVSSGLINSFQQIGGTVLTAVASTVMFTYFNNNVTVFAQGMQQGGGSGEPMPPFVAIPFVEGDVRALRVCGIVVIAAAVATGLWLTGRRTRDEVPAGVVA